MKRTIKYRALSESGWCYSDKHGLHDFFYGVDDGQLGEPSQFTGLLDKNGKEIYEGDIVKIHGDNFVIKYADNMGAFGISSPVDSKIYLIQHLYVKSDYEVIGNIFENPELLKIDN